METHTSGRFVYKYPFLVSLSVSRHDICRNSFVFIWMPTVHAKSFLLKIILTACAAASRLESITRLHAKHFFWMELAAWRWTYA